MFNLKRVVSISLVSIMFFSMSVSSYAVQKEGVNENINKRTIDIGEYYMETTESERSAEFENALQKINENQIVPYGPRYRYKTKYLPHQFKTISGYAGNQPKGGINIRNGGYIYYIEGGGPTVGFSVSVSLPKPYNMISMSTNIGSRTKKVTNAAVSIPANKKYYKLYVKKKMEVKPYVTYRCKVGSKNWEIYTKGAVASLYSLSLSRKEVK